MKEYKLVQAYSSEGLERQVTQLLRDKWECQGGVCVVSSNFFQAMTRKPAKLPVRIGKM